MLHFSHCSFSELSNTDLYKVLQLRQEIFIVEQDCPYLDADGVDFESIHVLGKNETKLQAYVRIVPPGISYKKYPSIGRVVNHKINRGKGEGKRLMLYAIKTCNTLFPNLDIKISAQVYLDRFYSDLGFIKHGDPYLEDGIPHQGMILAFNK